MASACPLIQLPQISGDHTSEAFLHIIAEQLVFQATVAGPALL